MRTWLALLLALASPAAAQEPAPVGGQCFVCHSALEDEASSLYKDDVHAKAGIGCADCHGGDPTSDDAEKSMSKAAGFLGKPKRGDIPKLCAKCHSNTETMKRFNPLLPVDQYEKYLTSGHGKRILKGDTKVAECASCHGAHGIRKVNDAKSPVYASNLPGMCARCHADAEYMKPYGIPTDQYAGYVEGIHGKAVLEKGDVRGAPACNDCHGNHGATRPGLYTVSHICGSCHAHNAELFVKSPMAKPFEKDPLNECVACHGSHKIVHSSDDWVGDRPGSICVNCHKPGDKGALFAAAVANDIASLKASMKAALVLIEEARNKGMDAAEADDAIQAARQALIQTRTELHGFSKPLVDAKISEGKTALARALEIAQALLRENVTRRTGLAVSSLLLTLLAVALWFKIRSLEP